MTDTTYQASVVRPDGITVTVSIDIPGGTLEPGEFSELAQIGLVNVDHVVSRATQQRLERDLPF